MTPVLNLATRSPSRQPKPAGAWRGSRFRRADRRELASGALDLAVDVALAVPDSVRRQPIGRDRLVVVARRGPPASPLTLARCHILLSSRRKGPGVADVELNRAGHQRHIGLRCQHYSPPAA